MNKLPPVLAVYVVPTKTFFAVFVYLSRFKQQRHMHSDSEHSVNH